MAKSKTPRASHPAVGGLMAAKSVADAWDVLGDALDDLGFPFLLYGGTRIKARGIIGDPRDALILHRGPQAYADTYLGEELYLHSPTYEWAKTHDGFASWPDAISQSGLVPSPQQMRILQLNAQFGLVAGYVGSFNHVVPGMTGVIGMSPSGGIDQAGADALWAANSADIEMLCTLLQLRLSSLPQPIQRRPLTTRQREALHWCSQGKTMRDIATIMGLSSATIEKHLALARDALDAQTTAHAVQKATTLNLLSA